jgi:hypothetical protein
MPQLFLSIYFKKKRELPIYWPVKLLILFKEQAGVLLWTNKQTNNLAYLRHLPFFPNQISYNLYH